MAVILTQPQSSEGLFAKAKDMIYAVLMMHICLVAINYRISRSWLYPPVVFTVLWSIVLFCLILSGDFFYHISAPTLLIFFLGSLAFSVGGVLSLARKTRLRAVVTSESRWTCRVLDTSLLLLVISLPFYIERLRHLSAMSGVSDFWVGLRIHTSTGFQDNGLGIFSYITMLGTLASLAAVIQLMKSAYPRWRTYLLLFVAFSYGFLSTARTGTIMLLFAVSCVLALGGKLKPKTISILAIVLVVLFVAPAFLLGKGISKSDTISENVVGMRENMQMYFLGGPVAFDQSTSGAGQRVSGGKSLIFFLRLLHSLGFSGANSVPSIIYNYSYTPRLTNLYTVYFPYYTDFGLTGVVAIMFSLGAALTFAYRFAAGGNPIFIVLFSLGFSMLILTSGGDWFLTSLSVWIQATLFSLLLYKIPPLVSRRDSATKIGLILSRSEMVSGNSNR